MGLQDTPQTAKPTPPAPQMPGMGDFGMPQPMNMAVGTTAGQFSLPGTPDLTGPDTAAGGQTNMAMMDQLTAMLNNGATPQDAVAALSQAKS